MKNSVDQLFQESLQSLYETYETGLNSLHGELSSLGETFVENDGFMRRALISLELRVSQLEHQMRTTPPTSG